MMKLLWILLAMTLGCVNGERKPSNFGSKHCSETCNPEIMDFSAIESNVKSADDVEQLCRTVNELGGCLDENCDFVDYMEETAPPGVKLDDWKDSETITFHVRMSFLAIEYACKDQKKLKNYYKCTLDQGYQDKTEKCEKGDLEPKAKKDKELKGICKKYLEGLKCEHSVTQSKCKDGWMARFYVKQEEYRIQSFLSLKGAIDGDGLLEKKWEEGECADLLQWTAENVSYKVQSMGLLALLISSMAVICCKILVNIY
ncbi:hypothetical protein DdX_11125 [Ditylenchus destructor]|uniref:Uncharacterized protein n=1 Tax=Ditylenchus destructor TaxID=166010 RepID=A0AAD4MXG9_9BILA|nr:hypothetical protein DdX_11125 [Ditylenchus destructor]